MNYYLLTIVRLSSLILSGYFLVISDSPLLGFEKFLGLCFLLAYIKIFIEMNKIPQEYVEWNGSDDPIN